MSSSHLRQTMEAHGVHDGLVERPEILNLNTGERSQWPTPKDKFLLRHQGASDPVDRGRRLLEVRWSNARPRHPSMELREDDVELAEGLDVSDEPCLGSWVGVGIETTWPGCTRPGEGGGGVSHRGDQLPKRLIDGIEFAIACAPLLGQGLDGPDGQASDGDASKDHDRGFVGHGPAAYPLEAAA